MTDNKISKIKSVKSFSLSFLLTISSMLLFSYLSSLSLKIFGPVTICFQGTCFPELLNYGIGLLLGWGGFFLPLVWLALSMRKQKKIAVAWGVLSVYIVIGLLILLKMMFL